MEDISDSTKQVSEKSPDRPAGQNLGIAALITAIVTFVLAVIPCVGIIAIIPGIIAVVLASVGMSQASRSGSQRGLLIAGLIIAIVASMISLSQIFVAGEIAKKAQNKFSGDIESVIKEVQESIFDELEDASVSIKIENNGETVEIDAQANKGEKVLKLEELEKGTGQRDDSLQKPE